MKAQDYRLGNLFDIVSRRGEVHLPLGLCFKVIGVTLFEIQYHSNEIETIGACEEDIHVINIRDVAPIELTEDWLKRLGCIEQRINSTKKNYWNKEKDFSVDVEFSFSGNLYYYNVSKDRRKPLIHVHKLQNLHYELKDEELKIK